MIKNLLENDDVKIEVLRLSNEGLSNRVIADMVGSNRTSVSDFLNKRTYTEWWDNHDKPIAQGNVHTFRHKVKKAKGKTFIITSAQNNTYVHRKLFETLMVMKEHKEAEFYVGTFSYSKNMFQNLQKGEGEWFDPLIKEFIHDEPIMLGKHVLYCGELNILPTVANPLSGYQSYTKDCSGIIPHAKVQMQMLPRHKEDKHIRALYTTGAITLQNYIQKSSGQKAQFDHVFGAILVEVNPDGTSFVRQLIADSDTGEIQDLDVLYTPTGWYDNQTVEAINWGDIHVEKLCKKSAAAAFYSKNSMLNVLKPKYQLIHDVYDAYYRSHHSRGDWHKRFELYVNGKESVKSEISDVRDFLESIERDYCQTIVVNSNHDRALDRWLNETDYRSDPVNSLFFLELQLLKYRSIHNGDDICLLEEAIKLTGKELNNIRFLRVDESFMVCGDIQCGMHGDQGISGARGSIRSFAHMGSRANIGHGHGAGIFNGVYQAGHMTDIEMVDYLKGLLTWSPSHIITYPNGKRCIVTMIGDKYRR